MMRAKTGEIADLGVSIDRPIRRTIVTALLIIHAGLLMGNLYLNFITCDEIAHVPAGLSHWQTGSFSLDRVNPPLARMLATLPLLVANPKTDYHQLFDTQGIRLEWPVGEDFAAANGARTFELIRLGRLSGIGWSLLGGWLVYLWARELYGDAGGCLALSLWCFDPNVLGFAPVVTPDLPATVAGLWATYAFRKYLQVRRWELAAIAGLAVGVALLIKHTLILLYGILPLMWLLDRTRRSGSGGWRTLRDALIVVIVSLYVLNLGYGFQNSCWALKGYSFASHSFTGYNPNPDDAANDWPIGNRFRGTWLGEFVVPLPADYLSGIDLQRKDFEGRWDSYLNGQWRNRGWWYYYLEAFAIKEPLGFLILILWGLSRAFSRCSGAAHPSEELGLAVAALVYLFVVSSQSGLNHHMRYVLPMFPYLMIGTGKLAYFFRRGQVKAATVVASMATWGIASSVALYPCSLSYFNEAAGGPEGGHAYLVDSNIDWGQDLLRLRDWLRAHPEAQSLHLAYFNSVDAQLLDIDYRLPTLGPRKGQSRDRPEDAAEQGPQPGYYAISVNFLRGMIFRARDGKGNWTPIPRDALGYFRRFKPIARAGYSIYIYHITDSDADDARRRMGLPPLMNAESKGPE
jgi:hypothetical protein